MKDKLKQIIEERRHSFDIYETDVDQLWPQIEKGIARKQRENETKWLWRVAAAFIIGVGITIAMYSFNQNTFDSNELAYQVSPEWAETEQYYAIQIDEKLQAIQASHVELDPLIMEDMKLLDVAYTELRDDLADGADNEEVINAMISNYQIKLEILERILEEVQEKDENGDEENFEL